ncbi:bi-domain-containing oxidoreductase [Prosthecomicrobium hirschii]|uniref:bi-domain-containing oxidoreductase n=1 Tax=Prosthecodimorpha hirschii TaxID=665126 RepID=UPI00221EEB41|nr:bi-domain-containing oxidoreductase [Prosthecomicrobium hirschii]MCW1843760.1 bi-domain-containing oxidoreductase [Prosthecomicrobium hirschii]
MKQVIQNAKGGKLRLKDVPAPGVAARSLLIRTEASLISSGTERQMVGFAQSNMLEKARARPDLVRKVVDKMRRDGPVATVKSVLARLDEPLPLGYSAAGRVVEVGAGLEGIYSVGQLVAVAGIAIANHAEYNVVPENLVAPVPKDVKAEQACFTTLASIALHSVRLIQPNLGDVVAVLGAGLVGLLAAQFARLSGARVVMLDYNASRLALAKQLGAEVTVDLSAGNPTESVLDVTCGIGCDAVLIAAATKTSEPFAIAAEIARDRGRVCLVGITGTEFPYRAYMQKELSILVSRSYGPGRYDRDYENKHTKYPLGYVRWTENENLRECARLMSPSLVVRLDVDALTSHRFAFDDAERAYDMVLNATEPHMGVVLRYDWTTGAAPQRAITLQAPRVQAAGKAVIGAVGAGNFGKTMILPALKEDSRVTLGTLVTSRGVSSEGSGGRFGFARASTDVADLAGDHDITAVVITTPHSTHAGMVRRFLDAGKHVFVEKPLALSHEELARVVAARNASSAFFTVGFNRRFAPYVREARKFMEKRQGRSVVTIRVNAGQLPPESWQRDSEEGNGRILGELCHFVDLAMYLVGAPIATVSTTSATATRGLCEDVGTSITFADGSLANIVYTALGDTSFSKELIECYKGGAVCSIDNFRQLLVVADGKTVTKKSSMAQDKGHKAQIEAFVAGVLSGTAPVDEQELIDSSAATLAVLDSLRLGRPIDLAGETAEDTAPATEAGG